MDADGLNRFHSSPVLCEIRMDSIVIDLEECLIRAIMILNTCVECGGRIHAYSLSQWTARHPSGLYATLQTQCICIDAIHGRVTILKSIYSNLQRVKSSTCIP